MAGYTIDDRKLAHIKVLVSLKLDRGESFYLSWTRTSEEGSGRVSLWISVGTPLQFRFHERSRPDINRAWIAYMMANSFGPRGVIVVDEDVAEAGEPIERSLF